MTSRFAEIERMMQDPTTDKQLLDQELDALLRAMDEFPLMDASEMCMDCGGTVDLNHIEGDRGTIVICDECDRGCPCCEGRCEDCGRRGHMSRGMRDGGEAILCEICVNTVEDTRGCGNCAGCVYCMSFDGYDPDGEV